MSDAILSPLRSTSKLTGALNAVSIPLSMYFACRRNLAGSNGVEFGGAGASGRY